MFTIHFSFSPVARRPILAALVVFAATAASPAASDAPDAGKIEFFEKKVRPILVSHCYQCHSADTKAAGNLRVDDRNGLLMGGDSGAAVTAGDTEHSLLIERVIQENRKGKMPKEGELLTDAEVADLKQWIADGVAWPREAIPAYIGQKRADYEELKKKHWAWQPLTVPQPPAVADAAWPRGDVDRFLLAGLEAKKLAPVADADRATLIRRVTFDLTGLPPTPEEIAAFEADKSPDAFARVVDRLLAAPAIWRAVGPPLARRGALRRIHRPFAQHPVSACLEVSRLRHRCLQSRRAVQTASCRSKSRATSCLRPTMRNATANSPPRGSSPWA
ncbi:MAG: DUF1549 domain-containing protein [Chthoniobacter sp.]